MNHPTHIIIVVDPYQVDPHAISYVMPNSGHDLDYEYVENVLVLEDPMWGKGPPIQLFAISGDLAITTQVLTVDEFKEALGL